MGETVGGFGGTLRATSGGALTAHELGLRSIWFLPPLGFMFLCGVAGPWPSYLWCSVPAGKHGPRGFVLVIGDSPRRVRAVTIIDSRLIKIIDG